LSFEDVVQKQIEHILRITQIYHLEILEKDFLMPYIIEAVNLLPNITTLKIHSLSTDGTTKLTDKEFTMFYSMHLRSKITKVYFEEIGDIRVLDFFLTLCPYVRYVKIGRINTMNVQLFLHDIFETIHYNYYHHFRSLCFPVQTPDDRIVEIIEELIKYEKLYHFTIKRVLNTVYLQWK